MGFAACGSHRWTEHKSVGRPVGWAGRLIQDGWAWPSELQSLGVRLGDLGGGGQISGETRLPLSAVPHVGPGTSAGFKKHGWNWTGSQAIGRSRNCVLKTGLGKG